VNYIVYVIKIVEITLFTLILWIQIFINYNHPAREKTKATKPFKNEEGNSNEEQNKTEGEPQEVQWAAG